MGTKQCVHNDGTGDDSFVHITGAVRSFFVGLWLFEAHRRYDTIKCIPDIAGDNGFQLGCLELVGRHRNHPVNVLSIAENQTQGAHVASIRSNSLEDVLTRKFGIHALNIQAKESEPVRGRMPMVRLTP